MTGQVNTVGPDAALYMGRIMHARLTPIRHRFTYNVYSIYLNIDRVDETARRSRLFSYNRFNLLSFYDRDHGDRDGSPLRAWVERTVSSIGIRLDGGPVRLLCFPRVLGYVFNPLSVYFCFYADQSPAAVIYQVHNTFGDAHSYVIPMAPSIRTGNTTARIFRQKAKKVLHVSPLLNMDYTYWFTLRLPADSLRLAIRQTRDDGTPTLLATYNGTRHDFTDRTLRRAFVSHPLMTLKVIIAIHWEALKTWLKGARFHSGPPPPATPHTPGDNIT